MINIRFPQSPIADERGYISLEWQQWLLYLQNLTVQIANGNGSSAGVAVASGIPGLDGQEGQDGWSIPGPQGPAGLQGPQGQPGNDGEDGQIGPPGQTGLSIQGLMGLPGMDGQDGEDGLMGPPGPCTADPFVGSYTPGSFTVPDGKYAVMSNMLQLTGSQQCVLSGTAQLRIT